MREPKLAIWIVVLLLVIVLGGCMEEEKGNIKIQGKGYFNSIQDAIETATDGDKIIVYPGLYSESIIINKSINLVSIDKNKTIISYPENQTRVSLIKINADNCTIDSFTIIGYKKLPESNGIEIISSNNTINNNIIQETYYGIFQKNSNNNKISNNTIIDNKNGIYMSNSIDNQIISNNITKNHEYGIYALTSSNNNKFKFNIFLNNSNGIRIKGSLSNFIEKNIIKNSVNKGIYLCCGAVTNIIFNNSLINNNPNADDHHENQWHYENVGNYWSDYATKYPNPIDENKDGFWDTPYNIHENTTDIYPLINSINNK